MKKVKAQVDYSVVVECPHCNESINLITDDNGLYDDDSYVSKPFFDNKQDSWTNMGLEMTCHHCDGEFELDEMEY